MLHIPLGRSGRFLVLLAAGFLAINALHVAWSQVIRTDIHASVFMLGTLLFSIRAFERGKLKDYFAAGLFMGFAIATKWQAASIFAAIIGAAAYRAAEKKAGRSLPAGPYFGP